MATHQAKRGQVIVAGTLLIAIIALSVTLSMYRVSGPKQGLRAAPVRETVLGITSDLDRALAYALSIASLTYNSSNYDGSTASDEGYRFISTWSRGVLTAYSNLGLGMKLNPAREGYTDVEFLFDWGTPVGFSYVATKFEMNVTALGFTGWAGESVKAVVLRMNTDSIVVQETPLPGSTSLTFQLSDGKGAPITNLAEGDLRVLVHLTRDLWLPAGNLRLDYVGAGIYALTMTPRLNDQSRGIILAAQTPEDKVLVQASYVENQGSSQTGSSQTFQSQGLDGSRNNGTINVRDLTLEPLPQTIELTEGTYALDFIPAGDHIFVNWTTAGEVGVQSPYNDKTTLIVNGSGMVTAFYDRAPPDLLRGWSEQVGGGNPRPGQLDLSNTQGENLASGQEIAYQLRDTGEYIISYSPNSSTIFLYWESEGNVTVESSLSQSTIITVGEGGGNVTAIYQPLGSLSLSSREENWESFNLGNVTLGNENNRPPPLAGPTPEINCIVTTGQRFTAAFTPQSGYLFLCWETIGNITYRNPSDHHSNPAKVAAGGGVNAMVAVYRHVADVKLNSTDWEGLSVNEGSFDFNGTSITLNGTDYTFEGVGLGSYTLTFTPPLNQRFVFWRTEGDVRLGDSTSNSTFVVVNGNCNITAVYGGIPLTGSDFGDWTVLYVDTGNTIKPEYLWSGDLGKLTPTFSTGHEKNTAMLYSPPTPHLQISKNVTVAIFLRPNPPGSVKDVYVEVGYIHDDTSSLIGNGTTAISGMGSYRIRLDLGSDFTIPEGSMVYLNVTVTFHHEYSGWGSFFLYYGWIRPSCVRLGGTIT